MIKVALPEICDNDALSASSYPAEMLFYQRLLLLAPRDQAEKIFVAGPLSATELSQENGGSGAHLFHASSSNFRDEEMAMSRASYSCKENRPCSISHGDAAPDFVSGRTRTGNYLGLATFGLERSGSRTAQYLHD